MLILCLSRGTWRLHFLPHSPLPVMGFSEILCTYVIPPRFRTLCFLHFLLSFLCNPHLVILRARTNRILVSRIRLLSFLILSIHSLSTITFSFLLHTFSMFQLHLLGCWTHKQYMTFISHSLSFYCHAALCLFSPANRSHRIILFTSVHIPQHF